MSHDQLLLSLDPATGTMQGQCGTCGWQTTVYPNNGIIPNQLTEEWQRHQRYPTAPTLELTATEVS